MVLSLVNLSLRSITKGIRDGTILHPHLLPPNLRERVMDKAMKQGLAGHPNGLALLTSVEFLNGITSLTVEIRADNDLIFLERLAASLARKLPNGDTVGAAIKKLKLKVVGSNLGKGDARISHLIAQCPNTTSLDLRVPESNVVIQGFWPLTNNSSCSRVMENLVELSLCNFRWNTNLEHPIINFRQLTTFKLNNCSIDGDQWTEVLQNIQSVENLHLFDSHTWEKKGLDWILPFPLPHLKSLEVVADSLIPERSVFVCNKSFVDNLIGCPELRQVHLKLDEKSTDEASLVRLANMDIDLKMNIRVILFGNDPAIFDSSSRFRIVTNFYERIVSFELFVWNELNPQYTTALEDLLKTCSKLTTFGMEQRCFDDVPQPQRERTNIEARNRVNESLIRFFGDLERAQQLKDLNLDGDFDETVLSTVFHSCVNLTRLKIIRCSTLRDQHLIDWVSAGGGKLTDLAVHGCNNVTSEGIIPILAKSAEGLLLCKCTSLGQGNGGRNWKAVCDNQCPNAIRYP